MVEPPPPPPPDEPAPPPPASDPGRCPNCGAPHDAYQEYCLECGRRLPGVYVDSRYVEVWGRDSPIWLWAALAALLLVALVAGAVVAIAATNDDKNGAAGSSVPLGSTSLPATSTIATQPPTITINPPTTTFSTTTIGTTTFGTTTSGTTSTSSGYLSWPAGKDGYTIVLKSVPTSSGRGPAETAANKAKSNGLPEVGILNSSDYSSLNPGYYVTFSGIYDNQSQANAALSNARSKGFPTAYVRGVSN